MVTDFKTSHIPIIQTQRYIIFSKTSPMVIAIFQEKIFINNLIGHNGYENGI